MISGIGIDIIEVARVQSTIEKNPRFLSRVFTPQEIQYCEGKKNKYQHLAARFAAKEAFFKAIGKRVSWKDIGVINLPSGKPQLEIYKKELFLINIEISLSHLKEFAVAVVVIES